MTNATHSSDSKAEFNFGYFYRTVEEHLNSLATTEGCPYSVANIALRVAVLLEAKALREEPGLAKLVPQMRKDSTRISTGIETRIENTSRGQALHVRARDRRPLSAAARAKIAKAQRLRWREYHKAKAQKVPKRGPKSVRISAPQKETA